MRSTIRSILFGVLVGCSAQGGYTTSSPPTFPPTATISPGQTYAGDSYAYDSSPTYLESQTPLVGYDVPDVTTFYDELAPYGNWYDDPDYGYVFSPQEASYTPYTNGYWTYTDYGLTWVSNEPFGWATSHYGRWQFRNTRWVWIPDTQWGPAWVHWRTGDNVVAWAPMGYEADVGYIPESSWHFVATVNLTASDLSRYYEPSGYRSYYSQTTPVVRFNRHGDRTWVAGPSEDYLRRHRVAVSRVPIDQDRFERFGRFDEQRRRAAEERAQQFRQSRQWEDRLARERTVRQSLDQRRREAEQAQLKMAADQRRQLEQQRAAQQRAGQQRIQGEQRRASQQQRIEDEQRRADAQRHAEEQRRAEQDQRRNAENLRRADEQRRQQVEQQRRQDEERGRAEQARRQQEERERGRQQAEQQRRQQEERERGRQQAEQQRRQQEERGRQQDEQRKQAAENQRRQQDEQRKQAAKNQRRQQDEQRKQAENQRRQQDEQRKQAENQRRQDEERARAEQARRQQGQRRTPQESKQEQRDQQRRDQEQREQQKKDQQQREQEKRKQQKRDDE